MDAQTAQMLAGITSATITAGASNYAADKASENVQLTNATNLALAREQNDWNLAQWQRENDYNSAKNQLNRWTDAGFTPYSFNANTGNAQSITSADLANQVPDTTSPQIRATGWQQASNQLLSSQVQAQEYMLRKKALEIQDKQLDINASKANAEIDQIASSIEYQQKLGHLTDNQAQLLLTQNDETKAKIDQLQETINLLREQVGAQRLENRYNEASFDARVKTSYATLRQINQNYKISLQQYKNLCKSLELMCLDENIKYKEIELNGCEIDLKRTQNGQLEFNLQYDKDNRLYFDTYSGALKTLGAVNDWLGQMFGDGIYHRWYNTNFAPQNLHNSGSW